MKGPATIPQIGDIEHYGRLNNVACKTTCMSLRGVVCADDDDLDQAAHADALFR